MAGGRHLCSRLGRVVSGAAGGSLRRAEGHGAGDGGSDALDWSRGAAGRAEGAFNTGLIGRNLWRRQAERALRVCRKTARFSIDGMALNRIGNLNWMWTSSFGSTIIIPDDYHGD